MATMGALHEGHLSLIHEAKTKTDITVCSIFVNPTQFNDPQDLEKYPRPIEQDRALLQSANCDVLFMPTVQEMYPKGDEKWYFDLGKLDDMWEGARRPGHYQGVTQIVKKLFDIVRPDIAFFGQKDFQQCMVVQYMVEQLHLPLQINIVRTVREATGLARSSRNVRLSDAGKQQALALSSALFMIKGGLESGLSTRILKDKALGFLQQAAGVDLEYLAICYRNTLEEVYTTEKIDAPLVAILAAWVEGVRLIDNVLLN